jgi:hypothetical protein
MKGAAGAEKGAERRLFGVSCPCISGTNEVRYGWISDAGAVLPGG